MEPDPLLPEAASHRGPPGLGANGRLIEETAREWCAPLAIAVGGFLLFAALSGLVIWLFPFSVTNQINVLLHTLAGVGFIVPCLWYVIRHWRHYWRHPVSHIQILGYVAAGTLLACVASGVVLTYEAALGTKISYGWDTVHILTTFAILAFGIPHILLIVLRNRKVRELAQWAELPGATARYGKGIAAVTFMLAVLVGVARYAYRPVRLVAQFPADYSFKYGKDHPFAPSLATTPNGQPLDPRTLSGSKSCGTAGCHEQIVNEWEASAHRYAAMDLGFQKVQMTMAQQNGPESTRYCGGCHDPISLLSGTKNLFIPASQLTGLQGYQEGVSCLACHSIRKVDLQGNANYVVVPPKRYLFEIEYEERPTSSTRFVRDFLLRAYPREHVRELSKTLYKSPEYCAACHKQFVDKQINNVGFVQLQNQYDNWRESHWNHPRDPRRTIECRECHMPLVKSDDPASGDASDYNRTPSDGQVRDHRFIAANQWMPALLKLPGWEKQVATVNRWLEGQVDVPEIADKWAHGPAVALQLLAPDRVYPGEKADVRVVITSNKVGHDFPTGPADLIQAWLEFVVTDEEGRTLYSSGKVDSQGFIQPGSFIFRAEAVDQYGNLIEHHNLWQMVGVRYRRGLFPGFSDTAEYSFFCPELSRAREQRTPVAISYPVATPSSGVTRLLVRARLCYRKLDQHVVNFFFPHSGLTAPVTVMSSAEQWIEVASQAKRRASRANGKD